MRPNVSVSERKIDSHPKQYGLSHKTPLPLPDHSKRPFVYSLPLTVKVQQQCLLISIRCITPNLKKAFPINLFYMTAC